MTRKVLVISDIHLCDQRAIDGGWGWQNERRTQLIAFLKDVASRSKEIGTLVVAGDMFDEWVAPMDEAPFCDLSGAESRSESDFFQVLVHDNQEVIDAFREVRKSGIELVYVPGNHDLTCTKEDFDNYLPGLFTQARDAFGLGAYTPAGMPDVVIEHGHRYDYNNMPNPISTPGGYFPVGFVISKYASTIALNGGGGSGTLDKLLEEFEAMLNSPDARSQYEARLASMGVTDWLTFEEFCVAVNNIKVDAERIEEIIATQKLPASDDEFNHFVNNAIWLMVISQRPPKDLNQFFELLFTEVQFPEPYKQSYRFCDIIPYFTECRVVPQDPVLFQQMWRKENWASLRSTNRMTIPVPFALSVLAGGLDVVLDAMVPIEYFENPLSNKRIVVFGHTHRGTVTTYTSHFKGGCIYANSGCWVDDKWGDPASGITFQTYVELALNGNEYVVSLKEWGKPETLATQRLSLR